MSIRNVGKGLRLWATVCGLVVGVMCLAGCKSHSGGKQFADAPSGADGAPAGSPASTVPAAPGAATAPGTTSGAGPVTAPLTNIGGVQPEVFRVGDSLTVTFQDTPSPVTPFPQKIKDDGTITLSFNESFKAAGKTVGELEQDIRKRYVPDYYKYLTVTVTPDVITRWYYVDGEVKTPSRQNYTSRITVTKAIASVGGFTDFANKRNVKLVRVDGRSCTINCIKALQNPSLDVEVYPGDKISVKRRILW